MNPSTKFCANLNKIHGVMHVKYPSVKPVGQTASWNELKICLWIGYLYRSAFWWFEGIEI